MFPSCKLKGNCTFATRAATAGNGEAGKDSGVKPEREEETESSAGEEAQATSRAGEEDQSIAYMFHFPKAIELHQKKNRNCFGCSSPGHLIHNCPKMP